MWTNKKKFETGKQKQKKRRNSFTHICNTRNVMSNSIVFLFVFFYLNYRVYFSSFLCLCIFKEKAKPSLSFLLCHKVCSPLYLSALLAKWFRFSMSLDLFIQNWSFYNRVPFNNNSKTIYINYIFVRRVAKNYCSTFSSRRICPTADASRPKSPNLKFNLFLFFNSNGNAILGFFFKLLLLAVSARNCFNDRKT